MGNNRPCYDFGPIKTTATLARALGIAESQLLSAAIQADRSYRLVERREKTDGTFREIFDAHEPLKTIQGRIKTRLLDKVRFPNYLQGGIRDRTNRRSIYADAGIHVKSKAVIKMDIANFFPSVARAHVHNVWRNFFRFSPTVADCLTKLTAKDDGLAQGAKTSTHLANLVLWHHEPNLYEKLERKGLRYSRFVDDITISCRTRVSRDTLTRIVAKVRNMLTSYGLVAKRQKQKVVASGHQMLVHGLVVNQKVNLPAIRKAKIRAEVHNCEKLALKGRVDKRYAKTYRSVMSKVGQLKRFDNKGAQKLRKRLLAIKPTATAPDGS